MYGLRTHLRMLKAATARFLCDESGPTATEYAVMLAVIVVAAIVGLSTFGDGVEGLYVAIDSALTTT